MRRAWMLGFILMFAVAGFAQEQFDRPEEPGKSEGRGPKDKDKEDKDKDRGDHDDDGPVQAGFAIITPLPTTGGTASMTVFATFGMKHGAEVQQAGILPPGLTTNALMYVVSSGRLSRNLGVALVNPDSSNTNVTMTLRDDDGTTIGSKTFTVESHNQTSKFVTELFAAETSRPRDINGTLAITSTSPVAVAGLRFRGANFSSLPLTSLSTSTAALPIFSTGIGGAGAVLLPQFAAGGGWATEIVIANTGTTRMAVRVDLFKPDGTALVTALNGTRASSFSDIVIPAGGVVTLAARNSDGDSDF
jgi:hypothetical protein